MLTIENFLVIFAFVAVSYGLLHVFRIGISQWLRWDVGEKERLLQQKLTELQYECDRYKEEVADLRKQVKLLIGQYDEAVIKWKMLNDQYMVVTEEARRLKDDLARIDSGIASTERRDRRNLIVALGLVDRSLLPDLATLRAVNEQTGLPFEVIDATSDKLTDVLDRSRSRQAITYLHLAIKSDNEGYQLQDKIVTADWLSDILRGVVIMVVAGSDSSRIADLLGVVPYVVSMNDKVTARDTAIFSRAFWTEVGRGVGASKALEEAFKRAPARMKEYVTAHWE